MLSLISWFVLRHQQRSPAAHTEPASDQQCVRQRRQSGGQDVTQPQRYENKRLLEVRTRSASVTVVFTQQTRDPV